MIKCVPVQKEKNVFLTMFPYRNGVASHGCLPHGRNAKISRGLRARSPLKPRLLILALRPWGKHPHGHGTRFPFRTDVRLYRPFIGKRMDFAVVPKGIRMGSGAVQWIQCVSFKVCNHLSRVMTPADSAATDHTTAPPAGSYKHETHGVGAGGDTGSVGAPRRLSPRLRWRLADIVTTSWSQQLHH